MHDSDIALTVSIGTRPKPKWTSSVDSLSMVIILKEKLATPSKWLLLKGKCVCALKERPSGSQIETHHLERLFRAWSHCLPLYQRKLNHLITQLLLASPHWDERVHCLSLYRRQLKLLIAQHIIYPHPHLRLPTQLLLASLHWDKWLNLITYHCTHTSYRPNLRKRHHGISRRSRQFVAETLDCSI